MKILLIDWRPRGKELIKRFDKNSIELIHYEHTIKNYSDNQGKSYSEIDIKEKIDIQDFDIVFIHGSSSQDFADDFVLENCTYSPIVVYGGGDVINFRDTNFDEDLLKKYENKTLCFFDKPIGTGKENHFKIEKFIEKWISKGERPSFSILYGYSEKIKENIFKINELFLPLIIDSKGLKKAYTSSKEKVTKTLRDYFKEIFAGKEKNYFKLLFLGIMYISFDIDEAGELKLSPGLKKSIDLDESIQKVIEESGFQDEKGIMNELKRHLEIKPDEVFCDGNLHKFFNHLDFLMEKRDELDSIEKKHIQHFFKLERNIETGMNNEIKTGIIDWYLGLLEILSGLVKVVDE